MARIDLRRSQRRSGTIAQKVLTTRARNMPQGERRSAPQRAANTRRSGHGPKAIKRNKKEAVMLTLETLVPSAPRGRFSGINRTYTPADVHRLRGTLRIQYTLAEAGAN